MPDIPEEAVQSAVHPDFKRILDERGGKVHSDSGPVMSCLREILTLHAEQIRADERRKVAEQIRQIVYDDGPMPLPNWRAFKARHPRLVTGDSFVAVVLAVADEIEGNAHG